MNNYQVSFYKNIADTGSQTVITIYKFLDIIKKGKYRSEIENLRLAGSKQKQTQLKKLLPNITASGIFKSRKDSDIITHSSLKQIDIDHDSNRSLDPKFAISQLIKDEYTFAAFVSPTGTGIKLLVKMLPAEEKVIYKELEHYYRSNFDLQIDTSCSNISRAMFVSYDPNLFQNPDSKIFSVRDTSHFNASNSILKKTKSKDQQVELLVKKIEGLKTDITGNYDQWIKIGFALASEFGS